jgi:hypothetical protein
MQERAIQQFGPPPPPPPHYHNHPLPLPLQQQQCPASAPPAVNSPDKKSGQKKKKASTKKAPSKKKTLTTKKSGSSGGKQMAFTVEEKMGLALIIDRELPLGLEGWDKVVMVYNEEFPDQQRTKGSLCSLFKKMYKTGPPTGTPDMPEHIQLAKSANEAIKQMARVSNGVSDDEYEEEIIE